MIFARWRHRIRFASGFAYAASNAVVTKTSKWSRIQDSCWITLKIESPVAYAAPDMASKFQKGLSITFWVILLTHTHRQTNKNRQKHYLVGGGNNPAYNAVFNSKFKTQFDNKPSQTRPLGFRIEDDLQNLGFKKKNLLPTTVSTIPPLSLIHISEPTRPY